MKLLQITDGTTTIDFLDMASGYSLEEEGYAPAVANVENSQLAGRSRYTTVQDSMQILVHDTTTTTANENLIALRLLMEKAERWGRGERVEPVRIRLQIADGELPQENVIYAPSGNGVIMTLPPQHMSIDIVRISYPVTLNFTRRGEWLTWPDAFNFVLNSDFSDFEVINDFQDNFPNWTKFNTADNGYKNVAGVSIDAAYASIADSWLRMEHFDLTSSQPIIRQTVVGLKTDTPYTVSYFTGVDNEPSPTTSQLVISNGVTSQTISFTPTFTPQRVSGVIDAPNGFINVEIRGEFDVVATFMYTYVSAVMVEVGDLDPPSAWQATANLNSFITSSAPATVPSIHTIMWDSVVETEGHMNPTDLVLSYFRDTAQDNGRKQETIVAIADTIDDIQLRNADDTTDAATKVSDTGRSPSSASGQVVSGNGELGFTVGSFYAKFAVFTSNDVFDIDVFATFRTTSSIPFFVNMAIVSDGQEFKAEPVIVQNSGVDPFVIYLGSVQSVTPIKNIVIQTSKESSSIVSNSIRMDSILVLNSNTRSSSAVFLPSPKEAGVDFLIYRNTTMFPYSGNVPNNYLTAGKALRVSQTSGVDITESLAFQGDLSLSTVDQSFVACALTVRGEYWTMSNTDGAKFQAQYTATRAITNLVPK